MASFLLALLMLTTTIHPLVAVAREKEVFVFTPPVEYSVWLRFDWEAISSIVWFGNRLQQEFTHNAWKHGVRVIKLASEIKPEQLANAAERRRWVKKEVSSVVNGHFNGINIDFEYEIPANNLRQRRGLVNLCKELYKSLKSIRQSYQISFDVAWSPDCIDNRCFDVMQMMPFLDFIFVMGYDERSQITSGPCAAGPNAAFDQTVTGLEQYLSLGVNASQIVLGVPWYGRDYPCEQYKRSKRLCLIRKEPFRGVNCSDSPGTEKGYSDLMNITRQHNASIFWDEKSKSPFFEYENKDDGLRHQVWFDNSRSLGFKYGLVGRYGLRGAGMWNSNLLDNSDSNEAVKMRKEFWSQLRNL